MTAHDVEFANDLLRGADEIAQFLFGDPGQRRKVYHLAETSKFPHFKLGSMICARKSVVIRWIEDQEGRWRDCPQSGQVTK
jgi:hypothetical protein